jgi:hypothetical protein
LHEYGQLWLNTNACARTDPGGRSAQRRRFAV